MLLGHSYDHIICKGQRKEYINICWFASSSFAWYLVFQFYADFISLKPKIPFMSVVAVYVMSLSMEIFEFILTYVKVNH